MLRPPQQRRRRFPNSSSRPHRLSSGAVSVTFVVAATTIAATTIATTTIATVTNITSVSSVNISGPALSKSLSSSPPSSGLVLDLLLRLLLFVLVLLLLLLLLVVTGIMSFEGRDGSLCYCCSLWSGGEEEAQGRILGDRRPHLLLDFIQVTVSR
jgi:hypothetical protein